MAADLPLSSGTFVDPSVGMTIALERTALDRPEARRRRRLAAGRIASYLQSAPLAVILGAFLLLPILMGTGLVGIPLIGTDAAVGLAMHIVKTIVFGSNGVLTAQYALIGVLIGAVMIPGAYIARSILRRMPLKIHERVIDTVIIVGGLSFLVRALTT